MALDPGITTLSKAQLKDLFGLLREGIKAGVVKPLNRTVFQRDEVEKAFRYMATGTHIGKVLIKVSIVISVQKYLFYLYLLNCS